MPYYDYSCSTCDYTFERSLQMSRVDEPTESPCPNCSSMTITNVIGAPLVCDPVRIGVKKAPTDFDKYVLGKIKAKHPKHNMGNTKTSHAKEI